MLTVSNRKARPLPATKKMVSHCCIAMTNYTNTYACRNITTHNKDVRHSFLEKYTSHFIERVVCERELETEQNCNILTPTLMAIIAFLSRSPGLLNRGPSVPLCWVLVFSTASYSQLIELPVHRVI